MVRTTADDLSVGDTIISTAGTPGRITQKQEVNGMIRIWVDWSDIGLGQAPDMEPTDPVNVAS